MKKLSKLVLIMPWCLVGCTTTPEQCDPSSDPSFFDKFGCVVSGSYEDRVEQNKQTIANLRKEQQEALAMVQELEQNRSSLISDRAYRIRQMDKLNDKLGDLEKNLAAKQALNANLKRQFEEAKEANNNLAKVNKNASTLEIKQKEKVVQTKLNALNETLSTMSSSNSQKDSESALDDLY